MQLMRFLAISSTIISEKCTCELILCWVSKKMKQEENEAGEEKKGKEEEQKEQQQLAVLSHYYPKIELVQAGEKVKLIHNTGFI